MAVYVDPLFVWPIAHTRDAHTRRVALRNGCQWCHMTADTPDELHAFAARLGLRRSWAQHEGTARLHYDLTPGKRAAAVHLGAVEVQRVLMPG